ncbi:MAG: RnfABCDGE type electron transport complex subunit G [Eubacterium sp.]|nr:RnfABCDGE type electron transport complex subunit G [Eubacterium sp.]MDE6155601.1 RnfABCDGE type electron transport complex subunit G [Eubacterium sp.]
MAKKKSSILVNTLVLFVVTFIAVLALAVVHQVTRGPIAQAEIDARAEIYKVVYQDAAGFSEIENGKELVDGSAEMLSSAGYEGCFVNDALAVTDASGNIVGYVIAATSPSGYGGDLQVAVGITKDGKITGFDVVSQNETAGLGSKCTEPGFTSQFAGKTAAVLEYTKSGASADNQIDVISGATITTNAATEAANAAIVFYQSNFGGGIKEAEEKDPMEKAFPDVALDAVIPYEFTAVSNENYTVDAVNKAGDMGYIITVTAHNAYHEDLQIALGIGNDGIIKGFATIVCNETKALGGQCKTDEFAAQFVGMTTEQSVIHVPSGSNAANNEIDMIASATITTDAVLTAVNGAIDFYNSDLKGE